MTGEIRNPAKFPTDLNPAEEYFVRCLMEGKTCRVGNGKLPEKKIESGEDINVVRGEVIRFFAFGGNGENSVAGSMIHLRGAWIAGVLDLTHADIPYALLFGNCHFVASVMMLYTECAALYLNGSRLAKGLSADGLMTKGNVNLRNGFFAEGEVRLLGANVGGNLDCMGGKFYNPDGNALFADGLTTKGVVYMNKDFSAEGEVRLLGANVGMDLECTGGRFHKPDGNALHADGLTTKGDVNLSRGFSAEGGVSLLHTNIGRNLNCVDGKFNNPNKHALVVEGSNINFGLFWWNTTCEGMVNLAYARADMLVDDADSWKSCKVILDGFTYNRFFNPMDAQSRLRWLDNRPNGMEFSPLPYEQAAKVLFGMGHTHDARKILLEKEHIRMQQEKESSEIFSPVSHDAAANILFAMGQNREAREILLERERLLTERGEFPRIWRWGRKVWDALAGYGYRPWLHTFVISLVIIVFGSALFCWGEYAGKIVPHQPAALVSMKYQYGRIPAETPDATVARKFSGYPEFSPILFSVDIFVPLLNLHQEPFWYPAPDGGHQRWWGSAEDGEFSWWFLLEWWYWFQIMAGGVLTSFFLLSIARLLRPRQSSGEKD